jgi:hypothetical protein
MLKPVAPACSTFPARRAGVVLAALLVAALAGCSPTADGRTTAPPWSAPTDVSARVKAAGLTLLATEGSALHTHQHLTVTVDGDPVTVPADIGIDLVARRISAIHTHDTSGIVHVESPTVRTFRLGQVFTEWNVRLAKGAIGPYVDGQDGATVAVFVAGKRTTDDPREIALTAHEDIDIVVTHGGAKPAAPPPFQWPAGY